jgi:hypothetical protein
MELQTIQNKIYEIRGRRVMLDFDLATLYKVETRVLNQSVKRNIERFPEDFMFQLTEQEWKEFRLMSQIVISNRGGTRKLPYAFTEQGTSMLSAVLRSDVAVQVSINIMRAFVAMRQLMMTSVEIRQLALENAEIRAKLELLERNDEDTLSDLNDLSEDMRKDIDNLYTAIGELSMRPVKSSKTRIGYRMAGDED